MSDVWSKTTIRLKTRRSPTYRLTLRSLDLQGNALAVFRALAVLLLARFLLIHSALETFHPVQSLAALQCRAVVLEPADDVGASQVGLDFQLAVLLRRRPLGSTEHLLGKQTSSVNKQQAETRRSR